jgi:hypothetical protein
MPELAPTSPISHSPDEKTASIMAYLPNYMIMGDVVVKNQIRVSTWLRTNVAPEKLCIYNARVITISAGTPPRPILFSELHVVSSQIIAFHLVPPAQEAVDYDPTEPNRRMESVSVIFGSFRADAKMRLSTVSTLAKYLELTREPFTPLYDVEISCPLMPELKMKVYYLLVKQATTLFGHAV